jgi:cytochrome c553
MATGRNTSCLIDRLAHETILSAVLGSILVASTSALAHDEGAGRKKAEATCAACHGPMGDKPVAPDMPRLAGQQYEYLIQALTAYRNGSRQNPIMSAMAQPLTEKDIHDLAWYFSRQQGLVTKY